MSKGVQIVCLLGSFGLDLTTQSQRLARDLSFQTIVPAAIIDAESKKPGLIGDQLRKYLDRKQPVPSKLVADIVNRQISTSKAKRFLLVGFPKTNQDEAIILESNGSEVSVIIRLVQKEQATIARLSRSVQFQNKNVTQLKQLYRDNEARLDQLVDMYDRFGKVVRVEAQSKETPVLIKKALKPFLIFVLGPPSCGKTVLARKLGELIGWTTVNVEQTFGQLKSIQKLNQLIVFLEQHQSRNFIIDDFFDNRAEAKLFFQQYTVAFKVIEVEATRNQVQAVVSPHRVNSTLQRYDHFFSKLGELKKLLEGFQCITKIAMAEPAAMARQVFKELRPKILVGHTYENEMATEQLLRKYQLQHGVVYADLDELGAFQAARGSAVGKKISQFINVGKRIPGSLHMQIAKTLLFHNPNRKRFFLSKLTDQVQFKRSFLVEQGYIYFKYNKKQQRTILKDSALLNYFQTGRLITVEKGDLSGLELKLKQRRRYGFFLGPSSSGQTTQARLAAKTHQMRLVEWPTIIPLVKQKYAIQQEEVPFAKVLLYLTGIFKGTKEAVLFDSFPYDTVQLGELVKQLGPPSFVIWMSISKEHLTIRFKTKNQIDPAAELSEEDQAKVASALAKGETMQKFLDGKQKQWQVCELSKVNATKSILGVTSLINSKLFRRVFVVNSSESLLQTACLTCSAICIDLGISFVDVRKLVQGQSLTPEQTMLRVKDHIDSTFEPKCDVMLFNYPQKPRESQARDYYPRPSDQTRAIQKILGTVYVCIIFTNKTPIFYPTVLKFVPEKPIKLMAPKEPVAEGGQGQEPSPQPVQEGTPQQAGQPTKFNTWEFEWSEVESVPLTLGQWFIGKSQCQVESRQYKTLRVLVDQICRCLEQGREGQRVLYCCEMKPFS